MYLALPLPAPLSTNGVWYDQYFGIMMIHIAFQLGFCTFVLSNYMKTLPKELTEAALVDGASVLRTFWQVILPLCKPPLAALATLEVTFIYNDFFWALVLMFTGDKRPITSSLNDLPASSSPTTTSWRRAPSSSRRRPSSCTSSSRDSSSAG